MKTPIKINEKMKMISALRHLLRRIAARILRLTHARKENISENQ